jgi:hypothetical protein
MAKPWIQTGLILAGAVMVSSQHYAHAALNDKKWCRVENNSPWDYFISNNDSSQYTSVGKVWIREKGSPTPANPALVKKGDTFLLVAGKKYEFYFDTSFVQKFAMYLHFQPNDAKGSKNFPGNFDIHVTNLPPYSLKGFVIIIDSEPMRACNVAVDPTGFRNIDGGVLFNIKNPKDAADDSDDDTDK